MSVFKRKCPEWLAGLLLGMINVMFYAWASKPYTIFAGYQNWGQSIYSTLKLSQLSGLPEAFFLQEKTSVGIIGLLLGASIASILANEFKIRLPASKTQVVEAIIGGVLMSVGVVLSRGCNWGGFFSAITALSLHGFAMLLGLFLGGYLGLRYTAWKISLVTKKIEVSYPDNHKQLKSLTNETLKLLVFTFEVAFIALVLTYYYTSAENGIFYTVILFFGFLVGVVIQRSRFCFTTAFRDLLYGPEFQRSIRIQKGIILGLIVSVTGTFVLKYKGYIDPMNYVYPVSLWNVVGGAIFAFGAVLAGGCASGVLWRTGEGYISSLLALISAVLSYPIARNLIRVPGVQVFIPNILGWELGLVATYFGLFLYFLLIYRLEKSYGKVKVISLKK
jgi:hypothetical protein